MSGYPQASKMQPTAPGPLGMGAIGLAFKRALISQVHPKMLAALFLPFVIALLGAIVLLWAFWSPLTAWLDGQMSQWEVVNQLDQWLLAVGLFSIKVYMIPVLAAGLLLPLAGILGLVIAAVFVMPIVLRHIEKRDYKNVRRQGQHAVAVGAWNAVLVGTVFVFGWLVTMPLWLFPPLALILPVFWWAFAFSRMMRVDALVEHANGAERRYLWRRHNVQYWLLGLVLSVVNLFPPMWLVLPVFSALVFGHYSLEALRQYRLQTAIQPPAPPSSTLPSSANEQDQTDA